MNAVIDVSRLIRRPLALPALKDPGAQLQVAMTPEVEQLLLKDAVAAIGVSGGKDSLAVALAVGRHLDAIGHRGPRLLVHADLGRVEWADSLPACQRLAQGMGWELMVVRRTAGDLLARWQGRWAANARRYAELECVKLILPWSTPALRFCTSELKAAVITRSLRRRFPTQDIVNVTGIRREESQSRARMPVSKALPALARRKAAGVTWNAIIEWPLGAVLQEIANGGQRLHDAYTVYGTSRVSCVFCIMSSAADLDAAARCADNVELYREMVELEALSGFGFQGSRWLADVAPHLLDSELVSRVERAKQGAALRVQLEQQLPKHLHYVKGWPLAMPTWDEAELIANVRVGVAEAVGLQVNYTTPASVLARYGELMKEGIGRKRAVATNQ